MKKFSGQNAITRRLDMMRAKWIGSIDDKNTRLVRWLCNPDELRMIDAFCLTESSEYGQLDDLFLRFSANIDKANDYDVVLLGEWLAIWNDENSRKQLEQSGITVKWDSTPWEIAYHQHKVSSFLQCFQEFAQSIEGFEHQLVIYIKPIECTNDQEWVQWVNKQYSEGIPDRVRLMISDINGYELFKKTDKRPARITIPANLNMSEAIKEIATSGNPNSPEVQYNTCLFKMNEALAGKNYQAMDEWGQKLIESGRRSGQKTMEVTGALSYGAALLQIRKNAQALIQFAYGRNIAVQGVEDGDDNCKPLLLYSHAFEAAVYMQSRDYKKAYPVYTEVASLAGEMQNFLMAADSSYMAGYTAKKEGKTKDMLHHFQIGLDYIQKLNPETARYSSCLLLGKELVDYARLTDNTSLENDTHSALSKWWGDNWLDTANHSQKVQKDSKTGFLGLNLFNFKS